MKVRNIASIPLQSEESVAGILAAVSNVKRFALGKSDISFVAYFNTACR